MSQTPPLLTKIRYALTPGDRSFTQAIRRASAALQDLVPADLGEEDGMVWMRTDDGLILYNRPTPAHYWRIYRRMPAPVRRRIPFSHYLCALDIEIRYVEGGLMYGGPRKQKNYRVQPGDCVAEMGAYRGYYTMRLAREAGPEGRIVAIEPHPDNVAVLRRNIEANGLTQVVVIERGVWSQSGRSTFRIDHHDGQAGSLVLDGRERAVEVEVDTLDNLLSANVGARQIDLMIIQLNGAEAHALRGLQHYRPRHLAIAARYRPNDEPVADQCEQILRERGYDVERLDGGFIFADQAEPPSNV